MSKEFEEIVLKKLDNTDKMMQKFALKLDNTGRIIQDVVLKKLDDTDKTMQEFALKLDNTDKTMQEFALKLDNTEKEVKDTRESLNNLSQNFARFEYEIIKKVDTLFDAYSTTEAAIVSLNTKYFNHDTRIANLEDKLASA